jgi:small-conductance mechanosensitive channel
MKLKRIAEVGDEVEAEGISGSIVEIGSFATTIESKEGNVVVPNTMLNKARIVKKR